MAFFYTCCITAYLLTSLDIEGMKDCQITNKASLLSCVSFCFSGYVYFTTTLYTFWTATISFLLTEGMECCSMLQFVSADALFFSPQQSQLPTTSMRFGLIWSNDNLWNCMSLLIHICYYMAYNMVQALDVYLYIGCTPAQIWWSLIHLLFLKLAAWASNGVMHMITLLIDLIEWIFV